MHMLSEEQEHMLDDLCEDILGCDYISMDNILFTLNDR